MEAAGPPYMDRLKPTGLTRLIRALDSSRKGFYGAFREEAAFRQELLLAVLVPSSMVTARPASVAHRTDGAGAGGGTHQQRDRGHR